MYLLKGHGIGSIKEFETLNDALKAAYEITDSTGQTCFVYQQVRKTSIQRTVMVSEAHHRRQK
jgi:hypothetical protein